MTDDERHEFHAQVEFLPPNSQVMIPLELSPDEVQRITAEQVWAWGACLDCGLPLWWHPQRRRFDSRRRYCRRAERHRVVVGMSRRDAAIRMTVAMLLGFALSFLLWSLGVPLLARLAVIGLVCGVLGFRWGVMDSHRQ